MDGLLVGILAALGFCLFGLGVSLGSGLWEDDCNRHGMHIKGDQIYICHKKP